MLLKVSEHEILLLIRALREAVSFQKEFIELEKDLNLPLDVTHYELIERYNDLRKLLQEVLDDAI